jgi:hypothetical protein
MKLSAKERLWFVINLIAIFAGMALISFVEYTEAIG